MKTKAFPHQQKDIDENAFRERWGLLWEMGTGKTRTILGHFEKLVNAGKVTRIIVVAPTSVHLGWGRDEARKHLDDDLFRRLVALSWVSSKTKTKAFQRKADTFMHSKNPGLMTLGYDALMNKNCWKYVKTIMKEHKTLFVLDEMHYVKTPSAARSTRVHATAKYAAYVRGLSGTPQPNSPFDLYMVLKILNPEILAANQVRTSEAFRAYFGVFRTRNINNHTFEEVTEYRNLRQLSSMLKTCTHRLLKEHVLDLPPKIYTRRYFTMPPEWNAAYNSIKDLHEHIFEDGELLTTPLAIQRITRLQQVTSGYIPTDECSWPRPITGDKNPRLDLLEDILADTTDNVIVWAKYKNDRIRIFSRLEKLGISYAIVQGGMTDEQRRSQVARFREGRARVFIGSEAAAGAGIDGFQERCATVVYYNTTYNGGNRQQSEDRAHRIGQKRAVTYIDLIALNTIDSAVVQNLEDKRRLAKEVIDS